MTLDEAIKHAEEVAKQQMARADALDEIPLFGMDENDGKQIEACYKCAEEHRQLAEWLKDYKRLLEKKNALDETQEQLDFVQPHKRIPVTLTVSGYDRLIDLANAIENDDSGYWTNKKISSVLKNISSIKPQPCEDAISKQAVLDKIKEVCFSIEREWVNFRVSQGSNGQIDFLIDYIEQLPSIKPQELNWIPVSERLPKTDNENSINSFNVLLWVKNKTHPEKEAQIYLGKLRHIDGDDGSGNFWGIETKPCDWTIWGWSYFNEPEIIAWMPLPKPYKGE